MNKIFLSAVMFGAVGIWSACSTAADLGPVPIELGIGIPQGFCGQWMVTPPGNVTYSSKCASALNGFYQGSCSVSLPSGSYEFSVHGMQTPAPFSVGPDGAVIAKDPVIVTGSDRHLSLNVVPIDFDRNNFKGRWGFERILPGPGCNPTLLPRGTMWYFTLGENVLTAVTTDRFGHVFVANPETYRLSTANKFVLNTQSVFVRPEGTAASTKWTIVNTEIGIPQAGARYVGLVPSNWYRFLWMEGGETRVAKFHYVERCAIEPEAIAMSGGKFNLGAPCKNLVRD